MHALETRVELRDLDLERKRHRAGIAVRVASHHFGHGSPSTRHAQTRFELAGESSRQQALDRRWGLGTTGGITRKQGGPSH